MKEKIYQLDEIDKKIINMLMENAKTSLASISREVGISTTAVHQRVKKLESSGVVQNDMSLLNPRKIGYKVISFVGIYLDQPSSYSEAISFFEAVDEIVEAHYITGNYTAFIKILARDNDHLMEVLGKVQGTKGVVRTETFISLRQGINRQLKID